MAPRESSTLDGIVRGLERRFGKANVWLDKTHGSALKVGKPDLIGVVCGTPLAIEGKAPGAKRGTTRRQRIELARFRRAGGVACTATCVGDVLTELAKAGLE